MGKLDKAVVLFFVLLFGVMLGYGWRMHHEFKNWDKWTKQMKVDALMEVLTEAEKGKVLRVNDFIVVKRADGSVVVRR